MPSWPACGRGRYGLLLWFPLACWQMLFAPLRVLAVHAPSLFSFLQDDALHVLVSFIYRAGFFPLPVVASCPAVLHRPSAAAGAAIAGARRAAIVGGSAAAPVQQR